MRLVLTLLAAALVAASAAAQRNYNLELLSNVGFADPDERGNDCWGFVDARGLEYAVIGSTRASYVYSLEDARAPTLRARIPGATSTWRDFKSFGEYIYAVADVGADGLLVIDMTGAPSEISHAFYRPVALGDTLAHAHNLYIEPYDGLLILAGANVGVGEPVFFDLDQSLTEPPFVGSARAVYAHDVFADDGRLYSSDIFAGELAIHDYTNIADVRVLGARTTSSNFTHNAWARGNAFAFTTDERSQASVDAYDVSDPSAIRRLDRFRPDETFASGSIPHNTHARGDYLVTSWYRDGVVVTDATRPHNLIEVGKYDTYPDGGGNGFDGCWGAYPFLPSGKVIASDIQRGLFVFQPDYRPGCYIEGTVQDSATGELLSGVTVDLDARAAQRVETDFDGAFATGLYDEGAYDVTFTRPGYVPRTIVARLRRGRLDFRNVRLQRIVASTFDVAAVDEAGAPLDDLAFEAIYRGLAGSDNRYDLYVAKWGYLPVVIRDTLLPQGSAVDLDVTLRRGYADDFTADLGWETSGTALRGLWERGTPTETVLNDTIVQLGRDANGDFGDVAYGTEVGGESATDGDVDGGTAVLTSPPFDLRADEDARVSFAYYFAIRGGATPPDDSLRVDVVDADGRVFNLLNVGDNAPDYRRFRSRPLRTVLGLGDGAVGGLRVRVTTRDLRQSGHVVEALFDDFALGNVVGPPLRPDTDVACAPATVTFTLDEALPGARVEADGAADVAFDGTALTATYTAAGTYAVRLTAEVDGETVTYRYPAALTVLEAPEAGFRAEVQDSAVVAFASDAPDATAYRWDFGDGGTATIARPIYRYAAPGAYEVTLAVTNACGTSTTIRGVSAVAVGVEELARETALRVVTNPVTDRLTVDYGGTGAIDVELADLSGRVLLSRKLTTPGRHVLDVSALAPGVYFLRAPRRAGAAAAVVIQR